MAEVFTVGRLSGGHPIIGHGLEFLRHPFEMFERQNAFGDLVRIRLGRQAAYMVNHPELARRVLVDQVREFDRGAHFEKLVPILGHGVMLSDVVEHRRHRRLMQPAFHSARMPSYVEIIRSVTEEAVESWPDESEVDLTHEITVLAVEVAGRTMFATDLGSALVREIHRSLDFVLDVVVRRTVSPFGGIIERLPTPTNRRFDRTTHHMRELLGQVIEDYRRAGTDHGDAMSMMIAARDADTDDHLTHEECVDDCMALLIGSSHTVGAALSFALHLLGEHPDALARMRAEVERVLADRPVTHADLGQLDYTRRFCAEVLRLYPGGWVLMRTANRDTELGQCPIPAGTTVVVSPYAQHHNASLFPDPERFDPDRWLPDRASADTRFAYIPFGLGVRRCPGDDMAMLEMPTVLATILQRWQWEPRYAGEAVKQAGQVLRAGPTPVRLHRRDLLGPAVSS